MTETADWTPINIAGPLPLDVATTLMNLIGAAYPSAVIDLNERDHFGDRYALAMKVDVADRVKIAKKKAKQIAVDTSVGETTDLPFNGFSEATDENGKTSAVASFGTPEELSLELGAMAHAIFTSHEDAVNYVEWTVRTAPSDSTATEAGQPGHRYLLTIAKNGHEHTPSILLQKAQAKLTLIRELAEEWEDYGDLSYADLQRLHDALADTGPTQN